MDAETQKRAAAARALDYVKSGMAVGLGTGSTARHFVELLGERVRAGLDIVGVPTSEATRADAERAGIRLTTLDEQPSLDVTIDGADEIAPDFSLTKGGGGALLREKIVAAATRHVVIIADESKWVPALGRFALPVEILPFGFGATRQAVAGILAAYNPGAEPVLRRGKDGHVFVTDGGHWILDAPFGQIADPGALAHRLCDVPGVMEHGLFVGIAGTVILAGAGGVRVLERPGPRLTTSS